jgi:AraC-like DNA-binding protein
MLVELADLVAEVVRLHRALEYTATRLERDERLAQWLEKLVGRAAASRRPRRTLRDRDNAALRRAFEYLAEQPQRNVGLQELATVAGIGKFRLIRLIRDRTGLPPHARQLAHRLRMARRLLEAGESVASVAASTGFADQSHLHRHFQRSLGFTSGEYRRRMARGLR